MTTKKVDPFEEQHKALEALTSDAQGENEIIFRGNQWIIPSRYTEDEAIKFLVKRQKDRQTPVQVTRTFDFRPYDGAWAFYNTILKYYGNVSSKRFREATMFRKQEGTQWIDVPTGVGETKSLPWGEVFCPVVPDNPFVLTQTLSKSKGPLFTISIMCPKVYKQRVEGLFKAVQKELETNSLYRGKAITGEQVPQFIDLHGVDPAKVVYPDELWAHLEFSVFSNIEQRDRLGAHGMPRKRAILGEGYYGSGKTLAGYLLGQKATANGITFLLKRPEDDINLVLQTASLYQPAVILGEDVDASVDLDVVDREGIVKMLDSFDGMRSKGTDIMLFLTTNHVDKLHKGLMRFGRLDDVITFGKFDAPAVQKLIEVIVGGALAPTVDWDPVIEAYLDLYPSAIVEAAQRSIRYALVTRQEEEPIVTEVDLVYARNSLEAQLRLMENAPEMSERDRIGTILSNITEDAATTAVQAEMDLRWGEIDREAATQQLSQDRG